MSATLTTLPPAIANFLIALEARDPGEDGWYTARCPAHDDRTPSLRLTLGEKGLVLKCHAGCKPADVARAAGFRLADLFYDAKASPRWEPPVTRRVVSRYEYRGEQGESLYRVLRYEPKGFSQERFEGGRWRIGLAQTRRVLYRLPELLADPAQPVVVVEGEKDADALAALGFCATTNVGGTGMGWRDEYGRALAGRRVAVVPDLDPPGLRHADQVVGSLVRHGAAEVRVVLLPGEGVKDVGDWLERTQGDRRRAVIELVRQFPGR
jgi:putative DNA primase/helicase